LAALGIALNAIDLKRFRVFSMVCYLGMGWLVAVSVNKVIEVLGIRFFRLLVLGGVFYTVGAALYVIGKKMNKRYIHSVFHIFVDVAALMYCLGIVMFIMPA
jgi:hemolysin III